MTTYIVIFLIISISAALETFSIHHGDSAFYIDRTRRVLNWIVLIMLILVSGTRLIGGTDYEWYENAYKATPLFWELMSDPHSVLEVNWTSTLDYGYLVICSIFKSLGLNFNEFCLVEAAFFYVAMFLGLRKYCNNFSIILLVFLAKIFFYDTFISMRQSLTIAIFFLSLSLIENRKWIKYLIVCSICFSIHAGSIIMAPVYFLTYGNVSRRIYRNWIIIFAPFALLGIFQINIVGIIEPIATRIFSFASGLWALKVKGYLSGDSSGLSIFYSLEYLFVAVLLYINFTRVQGLDGRFGFIIKLFMVIWPLFALFGNIGIITREKDYFILSYGLLLSAFAHMAKRKYKEIYLLGIVVVCGYEFFRFINNFDDGGMVPYLSWLF